MKTLLAKKQTDEQKRTNEYARYQFVMALVGMDDIMLGPLLKKDGVFLGYMGAWQFLHWLKKKFSKINPHQVHAKYKEGISLDQYPGSEMFEFSYAPFDPNIDSDPFLLENTVENDIFTREGSFSLAFVLLFEEGKIADIRVPGKIANIEESNRFQIAN